MESFAILTLEPAFLEVPLVSKQNSELPCYMKLNLFRTNHNTRWNRITMLVQVNNPPNVANGNIRFLWVFFLVSPYPTSSPSCQFQRSGSLFPARPSTPKQFIPWADWDVLLVSEYL